MGSRLGSFLRVLASGLSPQAAQANTQMFMQQQEEERRIAEEGRAEEQSVKQMGIKQGFASLGVLSEAARKFKKNPKELHKITTRARQTIENMAGGDERIEKMAKDAFMSQSLSEDTTGKGKARTVMHGGVRKAAVENQQGQLVDPVSGEFLEGATIAPTRAETGGVEAFTKKTQSAIQDDLIKIKNAKGRLEIIKRGFKPEFTEAGTKISNKFTALVEGLGIPTSKASKRKLAEFTDFARNSSENLNQHIRDRTGAVMNAAEVPRLMSEMPNLGTGVMDGDSATQYVTKTNSVIASLDAAEDRLLFVLANGLTPDKSENGKTISSSGLSLSEFTNLPPRPKQFNEAGWNKMKPSDRRRLVKLLNQRKR